MLPNLMRNDENSVKDSISIETQSTAITITKKKEDNDDFRIPNEKKRGRPALPNLEFELPTSFSLLQDHISKRPIIVNNSGNNASAPQVSQPKPQRSMNSKSLDKNHVQ